MNRSGVKDRRNDAVLSPEDDGYEQTQMGYRNFMNKARAPIKSYGDISHKRGAVSFNLGRIVPKNITHDKQYLYEQNIKLKQSVKQFQNQLLKLKTRLTATQNQKQKLVDQFNHSDMPIKRESSRAVRRNGNPVSSSIQNQNYMKRMLRQTKDETNKLKTQNMKLKRTVKYTQINQLTIQNKHLYDELSRLTNIIESKVLDQNENNEELSRKINELRQQLQQEKDNSRVVSGQMKKKNQQIQQLKSKIHELSVKEKKSRKDLDDYKKAAKNQRTSKSSHKNIKNSQYFNESRECEKCQQLRKQLKYFKQLQMKSIKDNKSIKSQSGIKNSQTFVHVNTQISKSTPKKTEAKKVQKQNRQHEQKNRKDIDKRIQQKEKQEKQEQEENQYEDNFDNDEDHLQKSQKNNEVPQNKKNVVGNQQDDQYNEQFDNIEKGQGSENEQLIFKKQQEKKKRQDKQILKETITYRMMCQKYSFQDLTSDIKDSKMKEFNVEQIATMLNDEPFYLNEEQLELLIAHIFGQENLEIEDKVKAKDFLKRIKDYIGDFQQLSDQKQDKLIQSSFTVLKKRIKDLTKQLKQQSSKNDSKTVTKEQFKNILNQYKLSTEQIQVIISQVAMISADIDNINYQQFLNKLSE